MTAHLSLHLSNTKKHYDCHDSGEEVSCEANHVENQDEVVQSRRRRMHLGLTKLLANVAVQEDETTSRVILFGVSALRKHSLSDGNLRNSHPVSTPSSLRHASSSQSLT